MPNVSREHKNNVFCLLFQDRKNLLSLYNAVNSTDYQNETELQVVTLEQAICINMKNDAAFVIDSRLNLYEQQSTVNRNIPLRNLYYVSEEYKKLVPMPKLYRKLGVRIPAPRFIVFYNGIEEQPEKVVMRLSDLYEAGTGEPELELIVTQYNINPGYNREILEKCESLRGYMTFVAKVRDKAKASADVKTAVEEAVKECIREDVLVNFFRKHKSEVIEMGIYEYDAEAHDRVLKEESREEGLKEGQEMHLVEQVCRKLKKGKSAETIAEELEEDQDLINDILAASQYVPDYDAKKVIEAYRAARESKKLP